MSTPATKTNQYTAEYSENILPYFMTFNDVFTWNAVSGGANATVINDKTKTFEGDYSLAIIYTGTSDIVFNSGGTQTECIAPSTGNYILSFRAFKNDEDAIANLEVQVYVNGTLFEYNKFTNSELGYNQWDCFFQNIELTQFDVVSFAFKSSCDTIGTYLFLDGFKLELIDRNQKFPSIYSLPFYRENGFAYYADSLATPTITIGTTYTQITIDKLGASTNLLFLPSDASNGFFDANKITPTAIGDDFDGRFDVTITAKTGSPTAIEFIIEIGTGIVGASKAFTGWIQALGTAPYDQSLPLDFFCLSTFLTNGGKLYMKTDTGSVTIGRRNIKLTRKSKG